MSTRGVLYLHGICNYDSFSRLNLTRTHTYNSASLRRFYPLESHHVNPDDPILEVGYIKLVEWA